VASQESQQSTLRDYLRTIRRRKGTVLLPLIIATGSAIGFSSVQEPVYQATAEVLLQPTTGENLFDQASDNRNQVQTEIRILTSAPVLATVRKQFGVTPQVSARAIPETDLFQVSAKRRSPKEAADIANTYVRAYIDYRRDKIVEELGKAGEQIQTKIDSLQPQIDELTAKIAAAPERSRVEANFGSRRDSLVAQQSIFRQRLDQLQVEASLRSGGAQLVTPATPPSTPVSPKPVQTAIFGAMLGAVIGLGLAFLFEHLDDTVKVKEDVERATSGVPVLGLIPAVTAWKKRQESMLISITDPGSPVSEAYRTLRTSINFLGIDRALRTLQITSPGASEGKSTTIANLAVALARAGQRVIVVGCDLRRPRIHDFFGVSNDVGFTNVLKGTTPLPRALQNVEGEDHLQVLASGPLPPNPSELLASNRTVEMLVTLQTLADIVLLDCPPVLPVTDAAVLSSRVDATLLVATAGKTTKGELTRAVELLHHVNAPIVGTVLNGVTAMDDHYGGYGGYSGEAYALPEPKKQKQKQRPARI
jgi:capsular exopolysaccharide synthesis family protein